MKNSFELQTIAGGLAPSFWESPLHTTAARSCTGSLCGQWRSHLCRARSRRGAQDCGEDKHELYKAKLAVNKALQCTLLLLTWGCLLSPPASQRTGSRSKSSCRLLASSSSVRSVQRSVRRHKRSETNPHFIALNCVAANKRTLARCDILDTGKSSMATTTPSWSRKPATTRGTPGRKDCAHHLSNLNLMIRSPPLREENLGRRRQRIIWLLFLCSTCESCCAVWECRSPPTSSAPRSTTEEAECRRSPPDSPPRQKTEVCDRLAGSEPQCRKPRWCSPPRQGQANCQRCLKDEQRWSVIISLLSNTSNTSRTAFVRFNLLWWACLAWFENYAIPDKSVWRRHEEVGEDGGRWLFLLCLRGHNKHLAVVKTLIPTSVSAKSEFCTTYNHSDCLTVTQRYRPAHVYCSNLYPQYIISSCRSVRLSRSLRAASVSTSLM